MADGIYYFDIQVRDGQPDGVSPVIAAKASRLRMHGSLDGWPPKGAALIGT